MDWHKSHRHQSVLAAKVRGWGDGTSPQSPAHFEGIACRACLSKNGSNQRVYFGTSYSNLLHHMWEHSAHEWPLVSLQPGCTDEETLEKRAEALKAWHAKAW